MDAERHLALARAALAHGETHRARGELRAGLALCVGPSAVRTRLLIEYSKLVMWDAQAAPSLEAARAAHAAAQETQTDLAQAELVLARALYLAVSPDCRGHYRLARRLARRDGDDETYLDAAMGATSAIHVMQRIDRALAAARAVERAARRAGRRIWLESARWQQARYRFLAYGDPERTVRELRELVGARGIGAGRSHLRADLALALAYAGHVPDARRELRKIERNAQSGWDHGVRAFYRSEVEWLSGHPARALAAAEEGLPHAVFATATAIRVTRLWSLFELGRPERDPALEEEPMWPLMQYGAPMSRAFGAVADGDLAGAEALLLSIGAAAHGGIVFEEVRACWGAGEVARRRGDLDRARELLLGAELRAQQAGLAYLLPRVRRSLRDLETRPRRRPAPGVLTRREREVLEAVAQGLSSREIAAQAGIAVSTVETHIRAAMTKLDARTRHHAVRLADIRRPARDDTLLQLLDEGATITEAARALGISRSTATRRVSAARLREVLPVGARHPPPAPEPAD